MSALTPERLAALRAIAKKATPGPWYVHEQVIAEQLNRWIQASTVACVAHVNSECMMVPAPQPAGNAAHIAAFDPPTVLALLDALAAQQQKIQEREAELAYLSAQLDALEQRVDLTQPGTGPWRLYEDDEGDTDVIGRDPVTGGRDIKYQPRLHHPSETQARAIAICAALNAVAGRVAAPEESQGV